MVKKFNQHLQHQVPRNYTTRRFTLGKHLGNPKKKLSHSIDKHLGNLKKKLNRSIGLFSKIRYYVPTNLLQTLHYSLFNSNLIYVCEIWGQN